MGKARSPLLTELIKVMIIFLVAVVLLSVVFFFIMQFFVRGKMVVVPNVIGKSFKESFDIMNEHKLRIVIEGNKYSAELPADYVVEQRPLPNEKVKVDRVIKVFLSQGTEAGIVPRVTGQSVSEAESILNSMGMETGSIVKVHSDEFPQQGVIIAQTPWPNAKIQRGSKVNLLVSMGPYSVQLTMPDLGGMRLQDATRLIESMGLKPGLITRKASLTVGEPDIVLEQVPQPNDSIENGITVNLAISSWELLEDKPRNVILEYKVPPRPYAGPDDSTQRAVKIVLEHKGGTRVIVDQMYSPGSLLKFPLQILGQGVAKIYVDDMEWPIEIMKL